MKLIEKCRRACLACNPDAASHKGRSHVQATDFTLAQRMMDDHTPTSGVTRLSPDVEDLLRKAMSSLFNLDPIDLLLIQHVIRRGNLSNFGQAFNAIIDRATHYRGRIGAMAAARKDVICEKFPQIAPVLQSLINAKDGEIVARSDAP